MRILYVISGLSIGGAEVALVNITNEAIRRGYQVSIVSLTKPDKNFLSRFDRRIGIITIDLKAPLILLISLFLFNNLCKKNYPDIIHSHMVHANIFTGIYKIFFLSKIPLIITAHSLYEGRFSFLYKYLKNFYNHCIHISKSGLNSYIHVGYFNKKNSSYIPNGVPIHKNMGTAEFIFDNKFITIGRYVNVKNHILMIDSIIKAKKIYSDVTLYIYGDGPLKSYLANYILSQKADKYIFLCESVDNSLSALFNAKFFLLSSFYEGMPMSLLEACYVGLPCVVTNVGSCPDIINNLPKCFVADINLPDDFYNKIIMLLQSTNNEIVISKPIIRQRVIDHFSVINSFNSILDIYFKFV